MIIDYEEEEELRRIIERAQIVRGAFALAGRDTTSLGAILQQLLLWQQSAIVLDRDRYAKARRV